MCKCLDEIRNNIIKNENANYVAIDCSTIRIRFENAPDKENITGQRIQIGYNHTKRNGEVIKKHRKSFVTHDYCPWCGTKH